MAHHLRLKPTLARVARQCHVRLWPSTALIGRGQQSRFGSSPVEHIVKTPFARESLSPPNATHRHASEALEATNRHNKKWRRAPPRNPGERHLQKLV